MKIIFYKGLECAVDDSLQPLLKDEETINQLLDHFFNYHPLETIEFVNPRETQNREELPMYTVSNGKETVLFWPVFKDGTKILMLELLSEIHDELKDELKDLVL